MSPLFKIALFAGAAWSATATLALAAPPPPSDATSVQEVIVTASRRSENLQNVAGAVSALGAKQLQNLHANSFVDFANQVPSLSYASGGPTNNLIAIRGVTTGGTQLGSGVGLYLDDVPLGASTQFGLGFQSFNVNLFDLDRVEVLDGPQGTLYGANSLGGALRYITQKPQLNVFDARAEIEGSTTAHGGDNDGLRAMVNMPLLDGKVAVRVDGLQEYDSGYTQDPTHDRKDVGSANARGGRIAVLAELTPDVDVRLSAFSQSIDGTGADVALRNPVTHDPVAGDYDQSYALNQPSQSSIAVYSAVVDWDLHWAKLTSVTAYQQSVGRYYADDSTFYDSAFGLYNLFYGGLGINDNATDPYGLRVHDATDKVTQEIRLASPNNHKFEWVIGGYFDHETTDESVDLVDGATPTGTIPAGFTGAGSLPFYGYLPSTYQEFAGFADGTYYFNDRLDLTLGVRYSNQNQNYASNISSVLVPSAFAPTPATIYHYQSSSNQGVATYLINPRFHVTDDTMVYARISSGFRPGGPNFVLPGSTLPPTFQPDKLWNYELGEKSTFLDHKATFDLDIYDIEWTDLQATENVNGINQLVNAGNAKIQGVETTFSYRVLPSLTLGGSAAYTDAHLTTVAPVLGVNYTGARLPLSPKYNFALNADYRFNIIPGYAGSLDVSDVWVGERTYGYNGSAADPVYDLPAYNTVNVSLGVTMPHRLELDLYVKNLFDTEGQVSANTLNNALIPTAAVPVELSQPRTVGLVLKAALGG